VDQSALESDHEIRRTLSAYCHFCDDGEFERLAEQFAADGSFVFGDEVVTGRPALVQWFESSQSPRRRGKHLTTNTIVDLVGDRAHAVSDYLFIRVTEGGVKPAIAGRYVDDLRHVDGRWLIERREATVMQAPTP
jgi:hypothetical protein